MLIDLTMYSMNMTDMTMAAAWAISVTTQWIHLNCKVVAYARIAWEMMWSASSARRNATRRRIEMMCTTMKEKLEAL
jgi:hypothetical protein